MRWSSSPGPAFALAWVLLAVAACEPGVDSAPFPDLTLFEPSVAAALRSARDELEQARRSGDAAAVSGAWAKLGKLLQAHHLQQAASDAYTHALEGEPDNVRWHYYLALAVADQNRLAEAASHLEQVLALQDDYAPAWIRLGRIEIERQRFAAARMAFERALAGGESAAVHEGLAQLALLEGDAQAAARHLERALRLQPQASRLYAPLTQAYRQLRRLDDMQRLAPGIAADGGVPVALDDPWFNELAGLVRSSQFYLQQGQARIARRDYAGAVEQFRLAVEANPDDAVARATLGKALERLGQGAQARAEYQRALALAPDNAQANYFLGLLLYQQGEASSLAHFERAIGTDPRYLQPRYLLAVERMRRGQYAASAQHYAVLATLQPDSLETRYWLGIAQLMAGDCAASQATLEAAIAMAPGNGLVMQALARAYSLCGVAQQQLGEALDYAQTVLDARPDAESHATLAMVLHSRGDAAGAMREQQAALALLPADDPTRAWYLALSEQLRAGASVRAWPPGSATVRPPVPQIN